MAGLKALVILAAALASCALAAGAAEARWLKVTTDHFNVYGPQAEDEVLKAALDLERFHNALNTIIRGSERPVRRLDVYLLPSREDIRRIEPDMGLDVVALYSSSSTGSRAMQAWGVADRTQARRILFHEYAHHFMSQNMGQAYPAWFVEGFAEYLATAEFPGDRVRIGQSNEGRLLTLANAPWISLEELMTIRPGLGEAGANVDMLYAQGWLLTSYLLQDSGRARQLVEYFDLLSQGQSVRDAFPAAFGLSFASMENRLKTYLRSPRMALFPVPALSSASAVVTPLDLSADDIMFLRLKMEIGAPNDDAERAQLLAAIRQAAAGHPTGHAAQMALAEAENQYGDSEAALRVLEALPTAANDPVALHLVGLGLLERARNDRQNAGDLTVQARNAFAQALKLDPTYYPSLYRYALTLEPGSEQSLDAMVQAHTLAPQAADLRINVALNLMRAEDYAYAARLLRPLANAPHASMPVMVAGVLLEAAEGKRPPPADFNAQARARLQAR